VTARVRARELAAPLVQREHRGPAEEAASLSEDLFEDAYREQGYFAGYPDNPVELSDALDPAAEHPPGLRVFVPLGIALEDVAVAAEINRRAADAGLGRYLPL
jgi:ornithine cyclodeaminase/alanine dehydrogenase-like protein (mu-crystallin family)